MKKTLLILALVATATVANAQVKLSNMVTSSEDGMNVQKLDMPAPAPQEWNEAAMMKKAPKKSFENGVYFTRPWGTYYRSYRTFGSGDNTYTGTILMVPGFTEVDFTNRSTEPDATVWVSKNYTTGAYSDWQYLNDEGNAYLLGTKANGYVYYMPLLISDGIEFKLGYDVDRSYYSPTDESQTMTLHDTRTIYTGFSNTSVYGLNGKDNEWKINNRPVCVYRIVQRYPKPMKAFCINSLEFYAEGMPCTEEEMIPILDGEGKLDVYFISQESMDTLGHMTATAADTTYYAYNAGVERAISYVVAKQYVEGLQQPVVVDEPFFVVIEGFDRPGVNAGIYMTAQTNINYEKHTNVDGAPRPTTYQPKYTDEEGGYYYPYSNITSGYWQFNSNTGTSYSMVNYLNGFFDVANALCEEMTAPSAGGLCTFEDGGTTYTGVYFQSTRAFRDAGSRIDNYTVEGLPDWLSTAGYNTDLYTANDGWVNILNLQAQALPTDVVGRVAEIYVVSELGAKTEKIIVKQGDVTGITTIENKDDMKTNGAVYSISGQRVGNDYKGLVIENGKKVIKK